MKGYKPPNFQQGEDVTLSDIDTVFNDSEVRVEPSNQVPHWSCIMIFNLSYQFENFMIATETKMTYLDFKMSVIEDNLLCFSS